MNSIIGPSSAQQTGRPRRVRLNLAVSLASVAIGLVLLEVVASILPWGPAARYAPTRFDAPVPKNTLGYRDFEYPLAKEPGQFRILVVGDSFTYGAGVGFDDTYPKRLERYLNYFGNSERIVYQVLNMGVRQRSTPEEVSLIREQADRLQPDLVVVGYCLNDAEDWQDAPGVAALRRKHRQYLFEKPKGAVGFLYRHSALARLVMQRLFNSSTARGQRNYYRAIYREDYPGWRKTRQSLVELGEFSRQRRIPAVVAIFPLLSFGLGEGYPFRDIHDRLGSVLQTAGLPTLDLLQDYRDMDRFRLEVVPYQDPHPNEIGHRIAAEALLNFLVKQRLIPSARDTGPLRRQEAPATPFR